MNNSVDCISRASSLSLAALPLAKALLVFACFACSAGGGDEGPGAPSFDSGGSGSGIGTPPAGSGSGGSGSGSSGSGGIGSATGSTGPNPIGNGGSASTGVPGTGGSAGQSSGMGGSSMGTGSGGSMSGAGMGGSSSTPAGTPCAAGLLLCDDFESASANGSPDPARWSLTLDYTPNAGPTENIAVDGSMGHNSSKSVRVNGASGVREIVGKVAVSRLFARAWLRVSPVPTGGAPVIMAIGGDQNQDLRLRLWAGELATLNTGNGDSIVPDQATSGNCPACLKVPANTWFCAEMFVDNSARSVTLWIDGNEAARVVNNDWPSTWPTFPAQTNVRFGFWGLNGAAGTAWVDDVAVGSERVGCN